jgi:predicted dehydrogenase
LKKIRVAVIGYGFLGKWHAEKAHDLADAELVAIVDSSPQSKQKAQEKFPEIKIVNDLREVIKEIDAAIVVTPTSTHFELVKYLLNNNKHVFCEKPLTSILKNAEALQNLLQDKKLVLQVGHSERFHEVWEKKERFGKYLTAPSSIKIQRYAPFKGRATDVDVVQDLMIHDLDLLNMLFDQTPQIIKSIGFKSLTTKWDHVESSMEFQGGNQANVIVGRNSVEEVRKVEITNKEGTFLIDLLNNQMSWSENETIKTEFYNKRDHLYLEQQEFYQAILEQTSPRVGCSAGVDAVRFVNLVLESLETGKTHD